MLRFRPLAPDDIEFVADVMTAVRPTGSAVDPVVLRYEWENEQSRTGSDRHVAEHDGSRVGFAVLERALDGPGRAHATLFGDLVQAARDPRRLDEVVAFAEGRAFADGATVVRAFADEHDHLRADVLAVRGYREDRRSKRWELDLVAERQRIEAMTLSSRERMKREGIRILTLADDPDPKRYEKIWRMSEEASEDTPRTLPRTEETLEDYLAFFRAPDVREDRVWIARVADDIVGISVLSYPPIRGPVGTAWTATARSVRGRGAARALKCETLVQAIALGIARVRTGNDGANAPILHINETMGYRPIPGAIHFLKERPG
jgi:hypothetical protein